MPATLRQVADACQVSTATVSRALSDHPYVDEALRSRIRQEARRLGYEKNRLVGALMAHVRRTRTERFAGNLALVHIGTSSRPKPGPQVKIILESAKARAEALGFSAELFDLTSTPRNDAALARVLRARGVAGVLFAYPQMQAAPRIFPWEEFSVLALDFADREFRLNTVCHDHYRSMKLALTRISQLGYKRVGLFLETAKDERTDFKWSAAFRSYQLEQGGIGRVPVLITEAMGQTEFTRWVQRHRPDVVIGHFDVCVGWLKKIGLTVPDDLGFFALNALGRSLPVAGIDPQLELQGRVATDTLISQIQHGERGLPASARLISVPGQFVPGPTLVCRHNRLGRETLLKFQST